MEAILTSPAFADYRHIFVRFGIPTRSQGLLLSQIYPMSKFESLGRFKRRLGLAHDENSSYGLRLLFKELTKATAK